MKIKNISQFNANNRKEVSPEYIAFIEANVAAWTEVEGVKVLRVHSEPVVACPCSGRKNSARFDIIDLETHELLCQLTARETRGWLFHRWEEKQADVPAKIRSLDIRHSPL